MGTQLAAELPGREDNSVCPVSCDHVAVRARPAPYRARLSTAAGLSDELRGAHLTLTLEVKETLELDSHVHGEEK